MRSLLALILFVPANVAAANIVESPIGGCRQTGGISVPIVAPPLPCLKVGRDNCLGGALALSNHCGHEVVLGSLPPIPRGASASAEFYKDAAGRVDARAQAPLGYDTPSDEELSVGGKVGARRFTVSYVKRGSRDPLGPKSLRRVRFSESQLAALRGALFRGQAFYHCFKPDRDPSLQAPAWLDKSLGAMRARVVWRDPDEGDIDEAHLWQGPASALYAFFAHLEPLASAGSPAHHYETFELVRAQYAEAVERLRRVKPSASLEGRGRAVFADYQRIIPEMKKMQEAVAAGDEPRYLAAVMEIAALSDAAYAALR